MNTLKRRVDRLTAKLENLGCRAGESPTGETVFVLTFSARDQMHAIERAKAGGGHSLDFVPTVGAPVLNIPTGIEQKPGEALTQCTAFQLPTTKGQIARAVLVPLSPPHGNDPSLQTLPAACKLTAPQLRAMVALLERDGDTYSAEDLQLLDDATPVELTPWTTTVIGGIATSTVNLGPEDLPR